MERSSQVVRRSTTATEQGIALCQAHADRFGLPVGWSFIDAFARAVPEGQPAKANGSQDAEEARDNPWFVSEPADAPAAAASTDAQESLANPTEGSLMHRAFHGPSSGEKGQGEKTSKAKNGQQKPKAQRKPKTQAKAQRKQKTQRKRKAKAASVPEATADEMNELPFPPEGTKTAV